MEQKFADLYQLTKRERDIFMKMIYKNRKLFLKFRIEKEDCLPDSPFSVFMLRIQPLHP